MRGRSPGVSVSYFLRHCPEKLDLEMDNQGWVDAKLLAQRCDKIKNFDHLLEIVRTDDKHRFQFTDDLKKIRCVQGHSLAYVKIDYESLCPPDVLYHGTNINNINSILINGIQSVNRNLVHLSNDWTTAEVVGSRKKAICRVLYIRAREMHDAGHKLYRSLNGVWLAESVPPQYIETSNPANKCPK